MSMMSALVEKLRRYTALYDLPPYGREIEGTKELLTEAADAIEGLSAKANQRVNIIERLSAKVGDAPNLQKFPENGDADGLSEIQKTMEALEALRMCETGDCDGECGECRYFNMISSADLVSVYDTAIAALRKMKGENEHGDNNTERL